MITKRRTPYLFLLPYLILFTVFIIIPTAMAIGLLIAGGLKPLQTISIAAAFPFIFIMFAAMVSVVKGLASDADTPNIGDESGQIDEQIE